MTIADKLSQILDIKEEIKDALIEKGSDVTDDTPFAEYPEKIQEISTNDGTNITINFEEAFYDLRTIRNTDFESLFKDFKGTELDLTFMCKEFHEVMSGMFTDCVNLESLTLTKWLIADNAITSNMFVNVPSLKKVIMNYTDFNSAKRILDELPDYTGAANGDYIFEIKEPNSIFTKLVNDLGAMYRGWTISRGQSEEFKVIGKKVDRNKQLVYSDSSLFTVQKTDFGQSYGEYYETSFYKNEAIDSNVINFGITEYGDLIEANKFLHLYDQVNLEIVRHKTINHSFDFSERIGDYDCLNLNSLDINHVESPLYARNSFRIDGSKDLSSLKSLKIFIPYDSRVADLIIENTNFNSLTYHSVGGLKSINYSNVSFDSLQELRFDTSDFSVITNITLKNVNLPLVNDISYLFNGFESVKEIDLSDVHFSSSNTFVANFAFWKCFSLEKVNLSNINPSNVPTESSNAFFLCNKLKTIVMANCPWYFVEYMMSFSDGPASSLPASGTLYCDMDMSSILPSGWTWKHSSEYTG